MFSAKTVMGWKLHESLEPGTVASARLAECEKTLESARAKCAAEGCVFNDDFAYVKDGKVLTSVRKLTAEEIDPVSYTHLDVYKRQVQYVVHDGGVFEVQLHELVVALPALVPEAVVIAAVAAEVYVEPVLIGRVPLPLLHVAEGPEATAHVVENAVEDDADAVFAQLGADAVSYTHLPASLPCPSPT